MRFRSIVDSWGLIQEFSEQCTNMMMRINEDCKSVGCDLYYYQVNRYFDDGETCEAISFDMRNHPIEVFYVPHKCYCITAHTETGTHRLDLQKSYWEDAPLFIEQIKHNKEWMTAFECKLNALIEVLGSDMRDVTDTVCRMLNYDEAV